MSAGSLTLWFMPVIAAGVLILAACHRAGPSQPTPSNDRSTKAQNPVENVERCATDSIPPGEAREIQAEIEKFQLSEKSIETTTRRRRIKVFFHVINKGEDPLRDGNIPRTQIDAQMNVLNDAYKSTNFQFELSGVDRWTKPEWFTMEKGLGAETEAKEALGVKQKDVLNIYTANILPYGWAVYAQKASLTPYKDGVVIRFSTLPGGTSAPYNEGKTMAHEVGHWLGLYHTFEHGCATPGDGVGDTPPEDAASRKCEDRDTCHDDHKRDPINNFMDYSPDTCTYMFTDGQSAVMNVMFARYRQGP